MPTGETSDSNVTFHVERHALEEDPTAPAGLKARLKAANKPAAKPASEPKFRMWASAAGKFKVEARLIRTDGDQVVLERKDNGKQITVPLNSLSEPDRKFAEAAAGDAAAK